MRSSAIAMVGAARFELATPCAQGSEIRSRRFIGFREFLMVTTIRGICFRSRSKFIGWNGSGLDTVLAQPKSRCVSPAGYSITDSAVSSNQCARASPAVAVPSLEGCRRKLKGRVALKLPEDRVAVGENYKS
jgi:hypothetical protein